MATFTTNIKPFPVPDDVVLEMPSGLKQDGAQPLPRIKLKDLSDESLAALIEEFAASVMAVARPEK